MRTVDQIDLEGKKVIVRVDFNVPLENGMVHEEYRITSTLPTLRHILDQGAALICCSHLGKPKGKPKPELSLAPVARRLRELLEREVSMAPDCIGQEVSDMAGGMQPGEVLMLENLRFHPGEKENDPDFSKDLASLADVYVNDAFGVAHRKHASVVGITRFVRECCAGLLLTKEIETLTDLLREPRKPYVVISGGAKVSSKLGIFTNLLDKVDRIIVGGAMANTFLKAQGYEVGRSMVEDDLLDTARQILDQARQAGVSLYLPVDFITGQSTESRSPAAVRPYQNVPADEMILDTGPASHALFSEVLKDAGTVVWNGPMGLFENPAFSQGSFGMAATMANIEQAVTIVGGGDTNALIYDTGLADKFSFVSTGGGSFLEFLEGHTLPAIKALEECSQ